VTHGATPCDLPRLADHSFPAMESLLIVGAAGYCAVGIWQVLKVAVRRPSTRAAVDASVISDLSAGWVTLNRVDQKRTVRKEYDIGAEVGKGAFGCVKKVKGKTTGAELVVKVIPKCGALHVPHMRAEIECHAKCDHPHIVRLFEVFETQMQVCLVMEACDGGGVFDLFGQRGRPGELESWHLFHQLMGALAYLHGKAFVAHRDLKPENLLIKEAGLPLDKSTIKLIDFGLARTFKPGEQSLKTICGTSHYMCPEIHGCRYDERCDIWAGGVLLYALLTGRMPFYGDSPPEVFKASRRGLSDSDPRLSGMDPSAQSLVRRMCSLDPRQRPSAAEVLDTARRQRTRDEVAQTESSCPTLSAGQVARGLKRYQRMSKIKREALRAMGRVVEDKDVAPLKNTFKALDTEGRGVISATSLKRALIDDAQIAAADVEAMTRGLAKDGDISYSAFLAANMTREHYTKEAYCRDAFRILDKDIDGSISLGDLTEVMQTSATPSFGCSSFEATEHFRRADRDGDGGVDFEEFAALVREHDECSSGVPSF